MLRLAALPRGLCRDMATRFNKRGTTVPDIFLGFQA